MVSRVGRYALVFLFFGSLGSIRCAAQSKLSLKEAVDKALESRASLKANAERVSIARGLRQQAGLVPNPQFQFSNENLRQGQTYGQDVDTFAFVTQPLDILGKRKQRIAAAEGGVSRSQAEYEMARVEIIQRVKLAYWAARGAQETQDLLRASVKAFQGIVEYHSARLSVGAISEQDFLRIRLEAERLQIDADLAAIEAVRARVQLFKEMGQTDFSDVILSEPLEISGPPIPPMDLAQVLSHRVEMRVANAAVAEAEAKARLEKVSARPDLNLLYGYKRTQLPDTFSGANTAIAGLQITLPIMNRNQGNRVAAVAELRRQRQLLAATGADVQANYYSALQDYKLRLREVATTLEPLRQHAQKISEIAQAAYAQGGIDLLRLLDAQRARIQANLAYVQGMVAYQQSVANLQAAEGEIQ